MLYNVDYRLYTVYFRFYTIPTQYTTYRTNRELYTVYYTPYRPEETTPLDMEGGGVEGGGSVSPMRYNGRSLLQSPVEDSDEEYLHDVEQENGSGGGSGDGSVGGVSAMFNTTREQSGEQEV